MNNCIVCGTIIGRYSRRCKSCAGITKKTSEERKRNKKLYVERHKHPCPDCGKLIKQVSTRCRTCNMKNQWKEAIRDKTQYRRGFHSPAWVNGRTIQYGYILIYVPDHPRAVRGYVREHQLVWEQANKKPLPKGYIIHHLNGIRSDNRICNLVALPTREHHYVLAAKAKRIQELEATLKGQGQLI